MSRMFSYNGRSLKTWNVFKGCGFECSYCNVRKMVLNGRLKNTPRYADGMEPRLIPEILNRRFIPGSFVFIGYTGDISFANREEAELILERVWSMPEVRFLFCSKNPGIYQKWGFEYPPHLYLGATIETNFDFHLTKAPPPQDRYEAMRDLKHSRKFISIEPLMNFHLRTLVDWIKEIGPEIVEIGPDNYRNHLEEPHGLVPALKAPWKVKWLLEMLRDFCPTVVEKQGLSRLTGIGDMPR